MEPLLGTLQQGASEGLTWVRGAQQDMGILQEPSREATLGE